MSRTCKHFPFACHRSPRGWKRAVINNVRSGAVPPHANDDKNYDKQCFLPQRIAQQMWDSDFSEDDIRAKLSTKFKLQSWEITQILELVKIGLSELEILNLRAILMVSEMERMGEERWPL